MKFDPLHCQRERKITCVTQALLRYTVTKANDKFSSLHMGRLDTSLFLTLIYLVFQGVGRRYANLVCRKADVDLNKRAGELSEDEV